MSTTVRMIPTDKVTVFRPPQHDPQGRPEAFVPAVGEVFEFTEAEANELGKMNPNLLKRPDQVQAEAERAAQTEAKKTAPVGKTEVAPNPVKVN